MKDAFWFKHDSNAKDDLKLLKIKRIHTHWGIGIYWEVIEVLRTQNEYRYSINESDLQFLCEDLIRCNDFTRFKNWFNDCINLKPEPLFRCDDFEFWSDSLVERMNNWETKKTNGGLGGRGIKSETKADQKLNESETKAKRKHKRREEEKREDNTISFDIFWDAYHSITKKEKTDKEPALKHWNKLTEAEKCKAIEMITPYFNSISDVKYCKKARTYLANKNFNDEYFNKGSITTGGILLKSENRSGALVPNPNWTED